MALMDAAGAGDLERVRALLRNRPRELVAAMTDGEAGGAVHAAAVGGHVAVLDALAAAGAELHGLDGEGMTPLHYAVDYDQAGSVRALLRHGFSFDRCFMSEAVLDNAAESGNLEIVLALAEGGAPMSNALFGAARGGHERVIEALLALGADPARRDEAGTALHEAAAAGSAGAVGPLVAAGTPIGAKDGEGRSALEIAVQQPDVFMFGVEKRAVTEALLAQGADPSGDEVVYNADAGARACVEQWARGEHPIQRERAELQRVLLSLYGDTFPAEMARLCGRYVHRDRVPDEVAA